MKYVTLHAKEGKRIYIDYFLVGFAASMNVGHCQSGFSDRKVKIISELHRLIAGTISMFRQSNSGLE